MVLFHSVIHSVNLDYIPGSFALTLHTHMRQAAGAAGEGKNEIDIKKIAVLFVSVIGSQYGSQQNRVQGPQL